MTLEGKVMAEIHYKVIKEFDTWNPGEIQQTKDLKGTHKPEPRYAMNYSLLKGNNYTYIFPIYTPLNWNTLVLSHDDPRINGLMVV
jgi:hypothetical protein